MLSIILAHPANQFTRMLQQVFLKSCSRLHKLAGSSVKIVPNSHSKKLAHGIITQLQICIRTPEYLRRQIILRLFTGSYCGIDSHYYLCY